MSNLVVIQSINKSRHINLETQGHHALSSVKGTVNSCVKNSQLLKDRIDNTIELVRPIRNTFRDPRDPVNC